MTDFTWKISGPAGLGIDTTGLIFSKAFSRGGYFVFDYTEFPSLIRGGRNTYQCRVSGEEIHSQNMPVHILVALSREAVDVNGGEVVDDGAIIYDSGRIKESIGKGFGIPLAKLATESGGTDIMANNVALGASMALLGYEMKILNGVIEDIFRKKGNDIVRANVSSAKAGYDYVKKSGKAFGVSAKKISGRRRHLITGNEATGAGAVAAGTKFYAGYPMTPTSKLLSYMIQHQKKFSFVSKQAHDEIAVVNTAIGAAFAGARAMVGTAGGGFALMSEGYGLAAMTETPLVIVVGQRPGPATGLPTWSSQADLRFVMHAHQDEFPRIVIAPGDQEECYRTVQEAHNIADRYQTPVILLTDKYLAESHKTVDKFPEDPEIDRGEMAADADSGYLRYKFTKTGISPRILPGTKGAIVVANSDEHRESGQSTEDGEMRSRMVEKRMKKLEEFKKELPGPKVYGDEAADTAIVGFGSVKGPVLEAMKILAKENVSAKFIHFVYVSPFPAQEALRLMKKCRRILSVENNYTSQFAGVIRENTGIEVSGSLLKYDGRPFYPEEIAKKVREMK